MSLLSVLQRNAFRKFLGGGSGAWGAIAAGVFAARTLNRWAKRTEDVVYRETLQPGETVTITHRTDTRTEVARADKAEAKAAKAAAKSSRRRTRRPRRT